MEMRLELEELEELEELLEQPQQREVKQLPLPQEASLQHPLQEVKQHQPQPLQRLHLQQHLHQNKQHQL